MKEKSRYTSEHFDRFGSFERVILLFFGFNEKSSLTKILRIFLIFGNSSLDDSYKPTSYQKKCVFDLRNEKAIMEHYLKEKKGYNDRSVNGAYV